MKKSFADQVVWITGASSGIGAALAKQFIKEGAIVALSARRVDKLNALARDLGSNAHVYELDVSNKAAVFSCAHEIAKDLARIDTVVANAGYSVLGAIESISEEMWRKLFDTNVFGVVWTTQAAIPYLKSTHGRIAIMSSVAGKLAFDQGSAYSASKFALMGFANSLYIELFMSGVSVTTIAPGYVESEISMVDNLGRLKSDKKSTSKKHYFEWPSDKAAEEMIRAIYHRKREVLITGHAKLAAFFVSHLPGLTYWGMAKASVGV